ncbi:MAG: phasin family protein [Bradyrhizobium sp.]|jgi:phasin family protein
MANPRQEDKSIQAAEDAVRRTSEKTAEQTRRIGETAVEAGQEVARAGADVLQQNAETLQSALRFSLDTATAAMGRSTDQFSRTLGLSGDEAQRAAERSARSAATVLQSTTAIAKGMSGMSQEYFAFVRHQIESSMERMNELWRCRTPQDVVAVQTDFVRETVESALESSRRMADISLKATEDTAKRMAQTVERRAA